MANIRRFTLKWCPVVKRKRHSISTIVKGFKGKSLDAVGQSILTFKFNTLLSREMTSIQQKHHLVSDCAYKSY